MKIGILGTGMVGTAIGTKLVSLGHEVKMGSRTANNEKASAWVKANGTNASAGTFEDAAKFGKVIFLCTKGEVAVEVLDLARKENLRGKTVIDVSNPLDFSKGMPPTLFICNTDSLGEQVQKTLPDATVVKTLNTMNCEIMVNPGRISGSSDVFMSGNSAEAKAQVSEILKSFGWKSIIDLGDITTARGAEMILPFWVRMYTVFQSAYFNFKVVR